MEPVAQSVEHVTFNHGVLGSSPSALTKEIKYLGQEFKSSRKPRVGNVWANQLTRQRVTRDTGAAKIDTLRRAGTSEWE